MEFKIKHEATCPSCSRVLGRTVFNTKINDLMFDIASCSDVHCDIKYSHLIIVTPGHPYYDFLYDREFYVGKFKVNLNYDNGRTHIKRVPGKLEGFNYPLVDFDFKDKPSVINKVKTLLTFG